MIKFFRQVRLQMLNKNKTGNYLKYAIGEIILVVMGILIALQINNWNEDNKNQKNQYFQLSKLRDNLVADTISLNERISINNSLITNLIFCKKALYENSEINKADFIHAFQYINITNNFTQNKSTFESLVASGKIELIENQSLLDALFLYYNDDSYQSWDSAIKDYSRNIIAPYIINFDYIPNTNESEKDITGFTQADNSQFNVPEKTIEDYKNDIFIINSILTKLQLVEGQKESFQLVLKDVKTLIDMINMELKRIG